MIVEIVVGIWSLEAMVYPRFGLDGARVGCNLRRSVVNLAQNRDGLVGMAKDCWPERARVWAVGTRGNLFAAPLVASQR